MSEQEFLKAYEAWADALFRHCYFRIYDRERARDLVQETFMKTWEYAAKGKEIKNMRAFLYRVATNLVIDETRKKKVLSLDQLQEESGFEVPIDERERLYNTLDGARLMVTLEQLDGKFREVLVMRYVDGLGPKEISEITGESQNVVSVRLHRAVSQLQHLVLTKI